MALPLTQPTRQPLRLRKPRRHPIPLYPTIMSDPRGYLPGKMSVGEAQAARFQDFDGTDGPFIEPSIGREKELQSILDGIQSPPPDVDTPSNGVSLLDGRDEGVRSKIKELVTNILDYMPSIMSEAEAANT